MGYVLADNEAMCAVILFTSDAEADANTLNFWQIASYEIISKIKDDFSYAHAGINV